MTNAAPSAPKLCATCGARYGADALFCPTDGSPLIAATGAQAQRTSDPNERDPYVGRELAGHIEVRQLAGVGAMGRVYRAFQRGIDRDVAVKILHRELSANAQLVARFHREAKVASRLLHPNVVQVHLAGQLPDGALYIVMEYLDGLSLQSALAASGGALPLPRALHVALQMCDAVGEAHAQGIVHRDLKPENVMLVHRGEDADFVKVLDFGIARLDEGEQSVATAAGLIFGTARYISPEGAQGEPVTPQGDVYALATLTYQMLAGRTPFDGDQAVGVLVQQIHDAPPALKSIERAAYVPEPIANVVMANLAKEKGTRAADARTLGRQLLDAAKASGLSPDDLVPRSILLGVRASGGVQLPSMQRTRQLQLERSIDEEIAARAGRSAPGGTEIPTREPTRTAYEQPADGSTVQLPPRARPATQVLVTPPEGRPSPLGGGGTQRIAPAPSNATAPLVAAVGVRASVPTPPPSGVDVTMDDSSAPLAAGLPRLARPTPPPDSVPSARTGVAPTLFDDSATVAPADVAPPALPARRVAIIVLFFLVGIGVTFGAARAIHGLGAQPAASSVAAARELPPPTVLKPVDAPARPFASAGTAATGALLPSLVSGSTRGGAKGATSSNGALHAQLDAFPGHPRLGQEVDLVVKIASGGAPLKKPLDDPHFLISGAALESGPARLTATDDGTGLWRASFTFLGAGKYEIVFEGKSDGATVHASRTLVAIDPMAAPLPPGIDPPPLPSSPPSAQPAPAPSASVKWL